MKQITNFWNWFQDNEEAIQNAFIHQINTREVFFHLNKNCRYISKRIGFLMIGPSQNQDKCTIVFTAEGYRKLFPKIIALEEKAPPLKYFRAQAFIKPMQEVAVEKIKNGTDSPLRYKNYKIKISQLQMSLVDYNIATKQLNIKLYMPYYDALKHYKDLKINLREIVMGVVGEIAFRKHIHHIEFEQLPKPATGLLNLIELPEYIDYLYKINSRTKTRQI